MRYAILVVILLATAVGCAHSPGNPTVPGIPGGDEPATTQASAQAVDRDGPYRLWGEFSLYINAEHDRVDVVPRRDLHMHLNALKFLEQYCTNCLQITQIKKNGDETIDLTVRITHPFTGFPEYTAFDMKGIIMFNGSYEYLHQGTHVPLPLPTFRISWRELGDPELLNPDGYTPRWSPNWDSGSNMPIFNYWEGRHAKGVPNADLNAYLNFYSLEERHMFSTNSSVVRTYHIWLPPGPLVVGYAVEACWEPPLVMPVTNPLEDFPITANQPEAYYFQFVANNGEVITDCEECCGWDYDGSDLYIEQAQWGGLRSDRVMLVQPDGGGLMSPIWDCEPHQDGRYCSGHAVDACVRGNGTHRVFAYNYWFDGWYHDFAYTIFDITVNDPNLE